jgi:hypothetical protein
LTFSVFGLVLGKDGGMTSKVGSGPDKAFRIYDITEGYRLAISLFKHSSRIQAIFLYIKKRFKFQNKLLLNI